MEQKEKLLHRLEQISDSLRKSGKVRALVGFGSTGEEIDRMDCYSDLDFLVVVKKGYKKELIENIIDWLRSIAPIGYYHMNTKDGFKLFYEDGIYCEFGVLEEEEVTQIPHSGGRIIWSEDDFDKNICMPTIKSSDDTKDMNWSVGEALTYLYVGLCRFARGEKLSATRYIQSYAIDHLLECSHLLCKEISYSRDSFQNERRYEKRYPTLSVFLPEMIQGYEKCPESALAILKFMELYFEINPFMKTRIENLANQIIRKDCNH